MKCVHPGTEVASRRGRRLRGGSSGGRRGPVPSRAGKMPVAVMAENSFSFKKLLEQCETQELEVRGGGAGRAAGTGPRLPGAWLRPRAARGVVAAGSSAPGYRRPRRRSRCRCEGQAGVRRGGRGSRRSPSVCVGLVGVQRFGLPLLKKPTGKLSSSSRAAGG